MASTELSRRAALSAVEPLPRPASSWLTGTEYII